MDKEFERQIDELDKLLHRMLFASQHQKLLKEFSNIKGLSTVEISIISIVSKKEDVILKDILEIIKVPKSTLTSLINRLEEKDFLRRTISKRDKRSYGLELTEKGKLIQKEHVDIERKSYKKMMMALETNEEREEFLRLIRKMADNINK